MRLIWAGTFDPDVYRNRQLADLMMRAGIEVAVVREQLWPRGRLWEAMGSPWRTLIRMPYTYAKLFVRLTVCRSGDGYLVSYPGWFDMPIVRLAALLTRKPVIFDPFISLWETAVDDRSTVPRDSVKAGVLRLVDRLALKFAHTIVADTAPQLSRYEEIAGRQLAGFVLPVGSDESVFTSASRNSNGTLVAFYGTYVPLQGIETIIRAAHLMREDGIRVLLIGDGQTRPMIEDLIDELGVSNVELIGLVPYSELPELLEEAAVCLGVFGTSEKAGNVVPHKVYDYLCLGKPVVTRTGVAIRDLEAAGAVVTVPPGDPGALSETVRLLISDTERRTRLATEARQYFQESFSADVLVTELRGGLEKAMTKPR
jgi:glycosyltransferase involved in cell wall biosynthesis